MAELMLKCTQESEMKSLVCHALEEDVTFMVREVTRLQSVMVAGGGLGRTRMKIRRTLQKFQLSSTS